MSALILLLVVGLAAGGLVFATRREPSAPAHRRGNGGCALDPGAGRQHALDPGPGGHADRARRSGPCSATWPSCATSSSSGASR